MYVIVISKEGKAKAVTSGSFVKKHKLHTPSSVQSAQKYLLDKDMVTLESNVYQVYDRFFGIWLKRVY